MNEYKPVKISTLKSIKEWFEQLREARAVLTWAEFAKKVGYNRTYVSRVINEQEPLTEEFIKAIRNAIDNGTFSVPRITPNKKETPSKVEGVIPVSEYIQEIKRRADEAERNRQVLEELFRGNQDIMRSSLASLANLQEAMAETQQLILAQLRAGQKYEAIKDSAGNKKKTEAILRDIDTFAVELLGVGTPAGSPKNADGK